MVASFATEEGCASAPPDRQSSPHSTSCKVPESSMMKSSSLEMVAPTKWFVLALAVCCCMDAAVALRSGATQSATPLKSQAALQTVRIGSGKPAVNVGFIQLQPQTMSEHAFSLRREAFEMWQETASRDPQACSCVACMCDNGSTCPISVPAGGTYALGLSSAQAPYGVSVQTLDVASTDGSSLTVTTMDGANYNLYMAGSSYYDYTLLSASSVTCLNSAVVSTSTPGLYTVFKCNNLIYACPILFSTSWSALSAPVSPPPSSPPTPSPPSSPPTPSPPTPSPAGTLPKSAATALHVSFFIIALVGMIGISL